MRTSDTLPIIIAIDFNVHHVESLVEVLKRFKRALGLTIIDIIGIPLGICSHNQLMPDHKPNFTNQRSLNSPMKVVVKKEIIMLFDVGVIYPISYSSMVCLVQYVPKIGGMIVVPYEKNELVPM